MIIVSSNLAYSIYETQFGLETLLDNTNKIVMRNKKTYMHEKSVIYVDDGQIKSVKCYFHQLS